MKAFDADRFAALARSLGIAPRHLLVALAQRVRTNAFDGPLQRAAVAAARAPDAGAEQTAALLTTPIASFALDETDRAFTVLWPPIESAKP